MLLLVDRLAVSTQQPVTRVESAGSAARDLGLVFWGWILASVLAALASLSQGGDLSALAGASALAFSASLAGFILIRNLPSGAAALGLIAAWLIMAVGLTAGTGGAASPLAACLLIPPALGAALRLRWTVEIAAASVLAFPLAVWIAETRGPTPGLGAYAEFMTAAALVVAGAFCALAIREAKSAGRAEGRREAALNRRVTEVAHELRTPLNHILGFADAIDSQVFGEVGARNREYAGFIRESGARLLAMVNDMLDMTKLDSGDLGLEFEIFDARELLDEAVREFALSAQNKSITLELKAPDAPLTIRADRRAWRRIITNTLGNAVKFTPEGGRITLSARAAGDRFTLDTADTGPGIPAAERSSLGAPYVRGEGGLGVEGTGLGLSFVRALAHAHGGVLSFSEAPGGGALVRVEAPIAVTSA